MLLSQEDRRQETAQYAERKISHGICLSGQETRYKCTGFHFRDEWLGCAVMLEDVPGLEKVPRMIHRDVAITVLDDIIPVQAKVVVKRIRDIAGPEAKAWVCSVVLLLHSRPDGPLSLSRTPGPRTRRNPKGSWESSKSFWGHSRP